MTQTRILAVDALLALPVQEQVQSWSRRDTQIYNLGIGFGAGAADDPALLRYVVERGLTSFPTMAAVIGTQAGSYLHPRYGLDLAGMLHGEESLEIARELPVEGDFTARVRIEGIWDRGPEKGAVMVVARTLHDARDDALLATLRSTILLRRDGGFGGSAEGAPRARPVPETAPDGTVDVATRPEQALLYRLSGDLNPLHAMPEVAANAGFPRPILHGLCSFATAARALVGAVAAGDSQRLRAVSMRFSGPVFPGETLRIAYWRRGGGEYAVQARVVERGAIVLAGGRARIDE